MKKLKVSCIKRDGTADFKSLEEWYEEVSKHNFEQDAIEVAII